MSRVIDGSKAGPRVLQLLVGLSFIVSLDISATAAATWRVRSDASLPDGTYFPTIQAAIYSSTVVNGDEIELIQAPSTPGESCGPWALGRIVPNPFTLRAAIRFEIPEPVALISLDIYDVRGVLVRRLLRAPVSRGWHTFDWDSRDERGRPAPAGVYFCRMEANGIVRSTKMIISR